MLFSYYVTLDGRESLLMQLISIIQSLTVISLGDSLRSRFVFHSMNYNAICCSSLELELIQERSIFFCTKKRALLYLKNLEQDT